MFLRLYCSATIDYPCTLTDSLRPHSPLENQGGCWIATRPHSYTLLLVVYTENGHGGGDLLYSALSQWWYGLHSKCHHPVNTLVHSQRAYETCPDVVFAFNAAVSWSRGHWIHCLHMKKIHWQHTGTDHGHLDEHFLGSDKAFLILSFPGMSPLLQLLQMLSECKCAHGFCWGKEGNHCQPAVYLSARMEEHEHLVWPVAEADEHGDTLRKATLTYGMGWMFWMPTDTAVLRTNNVTNLWRNGLTMMATMEVHPISEATPRKAIGLEIHL